MDFVIDFLVGNYMWFLVITIVLIFALIGYVVDSKEHKEVSIFDSQIGRASCRERVWYLV